MDRARFVHARVEDLAPIADAAVDVATSRSVLMYVEDRPAAFGALYRVLRPAGGFAELADPAAGAMRDFDDRDLVWFAEDAGFERIHLECHIDVEPGAQLQAVGLKALLDSAPNPLVPTLRAAMATVLSSSEREAFLAHLERAIAEQRPLRRSAVAYLVAHKPG